MVIDRLRLTELMAASKVSGRYDDGEYASYSADVSSWAMGALAYAAGVGT
mgnify:FL=1